MTVARFKHLAILAILLPMFCSALHWSHANYVAPEYYYLGIPYSDPGLTQDVFVIALTFLVALCLPLKLSRVSDLIVWVVYVFSYVPTMVMITIIGVLRPEILLQLQLSISLSMILIVVIPKGKLSSSPPVKVAYSTYWGFIFFSFFILIFWIIIANFESMRLVGLDDVTEQRFSSNPGISAYAMGIISGSVNPLLMVIGLMYRKPMLFAFGVLGQFIVYMVLAHKFVLLSVLYIPGFYYVLGGRSFFTRPDEAKLWRLILLALGIILVGCAAMEFSENTGNKLSNDISSILLMRTMSLPGGLVAQYAAFFTDYPLTYFTHISVVQQVTGAIYPRGVGMEVGSYLNGGAIGMNATANFFAGDGIASLYLWGPVVLGVIIGLYLKVADYYMGTEKLAVASLTTVVFAYTLVEASFFTTLLTGGGLFCVPIIYFFRTISMTKTRRQISAERFRSSRYPVTND
jgi:hypothetical protein